jgi:hypothetical protein
MATLACALALTIARKFSSFDSKGKLGSIVTTSIVSNCLAEVFAKKMWVILP